MYTFDPPAIAVFLEDELVTQHCGDDLARKHEVEEKFLPAFQLKAKLYRRAIILMYLSAKSREVEFFERILWSYELRLLTPLMPSVDEYMNKALWVAVTDLERLLNPPPDEGPFAWGIDWFLSLGDGVVPPNPVIALAFAQYWKDACAESDKAIEDFCPGESR